MEIIVNYRFVLQQGGISASNDLVRVVLCIQTFLKHLTECYIVHFQLKLIAFGVCSTFYRFISTFHRHHAIRVTSITDIISSDMFRLSSGLTQDSLLYPILVFLFFLTIYKWQHFLLFIIFQWQIKFFRDLRGKAQCE